LANRLVKSGRNASRLPSRPTKEYVFDWSASLANTSA
jgi:hypothetical protein